MNQTNSIDQFFWLLIPTHIMLHRKMLIVFELHRAAIGNSRYAKIDIVHTAMLDYTEVELGE